MALVSRTFRPAQPLRILLSTHDTKIVAHYLLWGSSAGRMWPCPDRIRGRNVLKIREIHHGSLSKSPTRATALLIGFMTIRLNLVSDSDWFGFVGSKFTKTLWCSDKNTEYILRNGLVKSRGKIAQMRVVRVRAASPIYIYLALGRQVG